MKRRSFLAGALIVASPTLSFAQGLIPIADAHNHLGLLRRNTESVSILGQLMKDSGICLLSWAVVPDGPFLAMVPGGVGHPSSTVSGWVFRKVFGFQWFRGVEVRLCNGTFLGFPVDFA